MGGKPGRCGDKKRSVGTEKDILLSFQTNGLRCCYVVGPWVMCGRERGKGAGRGGRVVFSARHFAVSPLSLQVAVMAERMDVDMEGEERKRLLEDTQGMLGGEREGGRGGRERGDC